MFHVKQTADVRHQALVTMLRQQAHRWTPASLLAMIQAGTLPEDYIAGTARYIKDKPSLWVVSDAEFIAAVRVVDPGCATIFARPEGIAFLHRMSLAVGARTLRLSLFG
jgi:hypothetical protein